VVKAIIVVCALVLAGCATSAPTQSVPASSSEAKPSDASIKELLAVTDVRKLLDNMIAQVDNMMQSMMQETLKGKPLTPAQQKLIDQVRANTVTILKQEMTWEKMESIYLRIYRDSFTQGEVDGIVAFYKSPAGRAVTKKLPAVMQYSMNEMQKIMVPLMQKLQKINEQALAELNKTPPHPGR